MDAARLRDLLSAFDEQGFWINYVKAEDNIVLGVTEVTVSGILRTENNEGTKGQST